jgi:hypothetical protein
MGYFKDDGNAGRKGQASYKIHIVRYNNTRRSH